MKILKIFGLVVSIHVFALVLIFANPGCSSSTKPTPAPSDTTASTPIGDSVPPPSSYETSPAGTAFDPAPPVTFDPDAPAVASSDSPAEVRFTPTRPGTPAAGTLVAEPVVDVTPATTYTVKSGDNLWTIAKRNRLTVAQLTAANNLRADANLRPGQKLLIPGKPASPTVAATGNPAAAQGKTARTVAPRTAAPTSGGALKHRVMAGETLGEIARRYGLRAGDIAVANNISDPAKIQAGTELVIPGWDAASGKSAKKGASKATSARTPDTTSTPAPTPATKAPPPPPPTIDLENTAEPAQPVQVPVIRIEEEPSPIVPAPQNP